MRLQIVCHQEKMDTGYTFMEWMPILGISQTMIILANRGVPESGTLTFTQYCNKCWKINHLCQNLAIYSDFHFPQMSQALDFAHVFGNWGGLVEIWTKGGNKQVLKA